MATTAPLPNNNSVGIWESLNVFDKVAIISGGSGVLLLLFGLTDDIVIGKKGDRGGMKKAAKTVGQFFLITAGIAGVVIGSVKYASNRWDIGSMQQVSGKVNAALAPTSAALAAAVKSATPLRTSARSSSSTTPSQQETTTTTKKKEKKTWEEFSAEWNESWKKASERKAKEREELAAKERAAEAEPKKHKPSKFMIWAHEKTSNAMKAIGLKRSPASATTKNDLKKS